MPAYPNQSYVGHYAKEDSFIPGVYNGMRMEVFSRQGELLFMADVQVISEEIMELVRTSDLFQPDIEEPMPVSIRGFNAYENCGIHFEGVMSLMAHEQNKAWIVKDIEALGKDTGRSFTRRPLQAKGWVRTEDTDWVECHVVNVSAGGVCFRTAFAVEAGDRIQIRFKLRRGHVQPPLVAVVRRATERDNALWEYGCEFVDFDEDVYTNITRTIIELQLMQD